jgi:two-component system response regulator AtoC
MLCTAHGSVEAAVEAMKDGASDFLLKPCSVDALQFALRRLEREERLTQENEYLREETRGPSPESIVAESAAMRDLLRAAARVARSKGTVLITGESGTGKERIAQFIHAASTRADQPFIRVNCAALSEQLWSPSCSATSGAHSPEPIARGWAASSWRTEARCSWTSSVRSRPPCKRSC